MWADVERFSDPKRFLGGEIPSLGGSIVRRKKCQPMRDRKLNNGGKQ